MVETDNNENSDYPPEGNRIITPQTSNTHSEREPPSGEEASVQRLQPPPRQRQQQAPANVRPSNQRSNENAYSNERLRLSGEEASGQCLRLPPRQRQQQAPVTNVRPGNQRSNENDYSDERRREDVTILRREIMQDPTLDPAAYDRALERIGRHYPDIFRHQPQDFFDHGPPSVNPRRAILPELPESLLEAIRQSGSSQGEAYMDRRTLPNTRIVSFPRAGPAGNTTSSTGHVIETQAPNMRPQRFPGPIAQNPSRIRPETTSDSVENRRADLPTDERTSTPGGATNVGLRPSQSNLIERHILEVTQHLPRLANSRYAASNFEDEGKKVTRQQSNEMQLSGRQSENSRAEVLQNPERNSTNTSRPGARDTYGGKQSSLDQPEAPRGTSNDSHSNVGSTQPPSAPSIPGLFETGPRNATNPPRSSQSTANRGQLQPVPNQGDWSPAGPSHLSDSDTRIANDRLHASSSTATQSQPQPSRGFSNQPGRSSGFGPSFNDPNQRSDTRVSSYFPPPTTNNRNNAFQSGAQDNRNSSQNSYRTDEMQPRSGPRSDGRGGRGGRDSRPNSGPSNQLPNTYNQSRSSTPTTSNLPNTFQYGVQDSRNNSQHSFAGMPPPTGPRSDRRGGRGMDSRSHSGISNQGPNAYNQSRSSTPNTTHPSNSRTQNAQPSSYSSNQGGFQPPQGPRSDGTKGRGRGGRDSTSNQHTYNQFRSATPITSNTTHPSHSRTQTPQQLQPPQRPSQNSHLNRRPSPYFNTSDIDSPNSSTENLSADFSDDYDDSPPPYVQRDAFGRPYSEVGYQDEMTTSIPLPGDEQVSRGRGNRRGGHKKGRGAKRW